MTLPLANKNVIQETFSTNMEFISVDILVNRKKKLVFQIYLFPHVLQLQTTVDGITEYSPF